MMTNGADSLDEDRHSFVLETLLAAASGAADHTQRRGQPTLRYGAWRLAQRSVTAGLAQDPSAGTPIKPAQPVQAPAQEPECPGPVLPVGDGLSRNAEFRRKGGSGEAEALAQGTNAGGRGERGRRD